MHPQLDFADQLIRLFGWPALLGAFVWAIRKWDKSSAQFKAMQADGIETRRMALEIHGKVNNTEEEIKAHTPLLISIDKSLAVIATRLDR
jgi:hypothetical protein